MSTTIILALGVVFGLLLGGVGLYLLYQILINFNPGKKRVQEDIRKMREEITPWVAELVPWNKEEMELFSLNQIHQTVKKSITRTAKGVFTSIYHEPMLAYAYKEYIGSGTNAILLVRTSKHEYVYLIRKKGIQIAIDGQALGTIDEEMKLYGGKKNRLLARINQPADESSPLLLPVVVKDREVASLVNPELANSPNPRAFEFLREDLQPEEENLLMSLAALQLVQRSIN